MATKSENQRTEVHRKETPKKKACKFPEEVTNDLEDLLQNDDQYDVIIKGGNETDVELRAHSVILRARCSYFKKAFSGNWEEKDENGRYVFRKPNISAKVFQIILRNLYTGTFDFSLCGINTIAQCLVAADELGLVTLIEHIQEFLFKSSTWEDKDAIDLLKIIYHIESLRSITDHCLKIISQSPKILWRSGKLPTLEKPIITMILQCNDLSMEEHEIWDLLLRWALAHSLITKQETTLISEDPLKQIKQNIQDHISLINFHYFSEDDFFCKVYPFKELLPPDLLEDLLLCFKHPCEVFKGGKCSLINSELVHHLIVILWHKALFEVHSFDAERVTYEFRLLLRGTRDGFDAATFHRQCDNKGASIFVAKVEGEHQLVGGYNPLGWSSSEFYLHTDKSFIFSVDSSFASKSFKLGRVTKDKESFAIYDKRTSGPCFGDGPDLLAPGGTCWSSDGSGTYSSIDLPRNFTIQEFEVFQVKAISNA